MARRLTRQLSLHCESPQIPSRTTLKKHLSADVEDDDLGIRISFSAKSRTYADDKIPEVKVAWAEEKPIISDILTSTKFKEIRPHIKNSKSDTKDSILCTKQDLTERLRQVLNDKDKSKQNLNIFLATNNRDDEFSHQEVVDSPKIIPSLQPERQDINLKNIFQKQIRKNSKYITSANSPRKCNDLENSKNTVVVVPIIERSKPIIVLRPEETTTAEENKQFDVVIRPSTAANKRALFQNTRTNSAIQPSIRSDFRPPLIRASSVPTKTETKPKFLSTKRKVKSAKRKDKDSKDDKTDTTKKGDIITMVSLVSPSESDNEEEASVDPPKDTTCKKANLSKKEEHAKTFSLRKAVKTVSFQQSSIHAIRSFSASFPSRRSSVATTLLLGNAAKKLNSHLQRDRRVTADDEQVVPKRRLVRSSSATSAEIQQPIEMEQEKSVEIVVQDSKTPEEVVIVPVVEKKQTPKEKECWDMYCKMNQRGLTISFDTILRGMLTPTEYRLHRKTHSEEDNYR